MDRPNIHTTFLNFLQDEAFSDTPTTLTTLQSFRSDGLLLPYPTVGSVASTESRIAKEPDIPEVLRNKLKLRVLIFALCLAVLLAALDTTIVTTALPTIAEHFHSTSGYIWVGSAYLLSTAASVTTFGKLSDIWGRRPILLIACAIFFIGSLLCAIAINIGMLIAARAIQGMGSGAMLTLVNIVICDLFSQRDRPAYFAITGFMWAIAGAMGPVIGGVFAEKSSWRWCFYINLPLTGIAFIYIFFTVKLDTEKIPLLVGLKAIDWLGSFLIVAATTIFLLGLQFGGSTFPWSSSIVVCLLVFGGLTFLLFLLAEWRLASSPIMPLHLFQSSSTIGCFLICFCHGTLFIATSYYLPLYFQAVLGSSSLLSGVYLLPLVVSVGVGTACIGVFVKKTGNCFDPITIGAATATLGIGLLISLDTTENWAKVIIYQIIIGAGLAANFQCPPQAQQAHLPPQDIATANAAYSFVRYMSFAIGVVIGGAIFQNSMQKRLPDLQAALPPDIARLLAGDAAGANVQIVDRLPPAQKAIARAAFQRSLRSVWVLFVSISAASILFSFLIRKKALMTSHQVTQTGLKAEDARKKGRADVEHEAESTVLT